MGGRLTRRKILMGLALVLAISLGIGSITALGPIATGPVATAGARFQKAFDHALPFRQSAVDLWARARWALFGQGWRGVLIGKDGWLFTAEEFGEAPAASLKDPRADLVRVRDALAERGIALVVVPIPAKARIHANKLGAPVPWPGRYDAILNLCSELGVPAVDLRPALTAQGREVFLRTDTHWTPYGASRAAAAVAVFARQGFSLPDPATSSSVTLGAAQSYRGDLLAYLPGRGVPWRPLPDADMLDGIALEAVQASADDFSAALFGEAQLPVALVGTSYSASERWGFASFLEAELGLGVLNLAAEGEGPFAPMQAALESGVLAENGVRLVLWEVPERYCRP